MSDAKNMPSARSISQCQVHFALMMRKTKRKGLTYFRGLGAAWHHLTKTTLRDVLEGDQEPTLEHAGAVLLNDFFQTVFGLDAQLTELYGASTKVPARFVPVFRDGRIVVAVGFNPDGSIDRSFNTTIPAEVVADAEAIPDPEDVTVTSHGTAVLIGPTPDLTQEERRTLIRSAGQTIRSPHAS